MDGPAGVDGAVIRICAEGLGPGGFSVTTKVGQACPQVYAPGVDFGESIPEVWQVLEYVIEVGRGGTYPTVTPGQYSKLRSP
jgi:hypothetical protein